MMSTEGSLRLSPDLTLAYTRYAAPAPAPGPAALRVLCAHGWVDNAASFGLLAPALAARLRADVVCLDLAGHGRSSHRSPGAVYQALHYAADIARALEELGWAGAEGEGPEGEAEEASRRPPVVLVGHSMGAGLMSAVAGAFPERAAALVMLEGLGLVARAPAEAPAGFRAACAALREQQVRRPRDGGGGGGGGGVYSSVAQAVDQRLATVTRLPGAQTLSRAAAEALVRRALDELPPAAAAASAAASDAAVGAEVPALAPALAPAPAPAPTRFSFRHDRRVLSPSLLSVSEEAALAFLRGVRCAALFVSAQRGWPVAPAVLQERLAALSGGAASLAHVHLPGSHHLHLDADTAPAVASAVCSFLEGALKLAPQPPPGGPGGS